MVFSSIEFLFLFLPAFLLVQSLFPSRNLTYVAFSLAFYFVGEGWYTGLVCLSVLMNYACGLWIDRASSQAARSFAVSISVSFNLLLLFLFKYLGFFAEVFLGNTQVSLHLPLGISFFTFHAISYLVDVYRRDARAERSLVNLSLYILMFPQLIAGPILRFHSIARMLHRRLVRPQHVYFGFTLFCMGLGQKVLLADVLAGVCDPLFLRWETLSTQTAWLAAITYSLQLFFDFSGYSNMAIGLGLVTGFRFPRNFNYPYISKSITEFWRRWHMTLSQWFRDYVYIPLGGNRHGTVQTYRNLILVFLLCGLWHGAAWTFVLWGVYHGAVLVLERVGLEAILRRLPAVIQHGYALVVIVFGWVLFRSTSIEQALGIMRTMVVPTSSEELTAWQLLNGEETLALVLAILLSTPVAVRLASRVIALPAPPTWRHELAFWPGSIGALSALAIFAASSIKILAGSYSPFIYFRF